MKDRRVGDYSLVLLTGDENLQFPSLFAFRPPNPNCLLIKAKKPPKVLRWAYREERDRRLEENANAMKVAKDAESLVRELQMVQDRLRIEQNRITKIQVATEKLGKVIEVLVRPERSEPRRLS